MVLKPAPQTPLSSLLLAEVVQQAGWPDGGLNVLPLSNDDASLLVTDDRLKLISFTGSAAVGWQIKKNSGKKKVVLELGGNAGVIVHGTPTSPTRPTAAWPAASITPVRPASRCSASWSSNRSTESFSTHCWPG